MVLFVGNIFRKLPDFKGKRRLIRGLLGHKLKKLKDLTIKGKYNLLYKIPNCIESIGYEIFINGIYEKETSDFITQRIPKDGIYIDIGANIGSISLPICKKRPDIKTICIEASTGIFEYLEFNFKINNINNYLLLKNAISDKEGEFIGFYIPDEQFGKGHFSSKSDEMSEKVETITLDKIRENLTLKEIDFIKIDIEGYEYYAFKGASDLLISNSAPDILFEFIDSGEANADGLTAGDAQKLLIEFGYKLFKMHNSHPILLKNPLLHGQAMILASKKYHA